MPDLVFPRTPFPEEGDCIPLEPPAPHVHPSHSLRSHSSLRREVTGAILYPAYPGSLPRPPSPSASMPTHVLVIFPCQLYPDLDWGRHSGFIPEVQEVGALPPHPHWGVPSPDPCLLRRPPTSSRRAPPCSCRWLHRCALQSYRWRILSIYFFFTLFGGKNTEFF